MSVTSFGNCVAEAVAGVTRNYPASEIGMTESSRPKRTTRFCSSDFFWGYQTSDFRSAPDEPQVAVQRDGQESRTTPGKGVSYGLQQK